MLSILFCLAQSPVVLQDRTPVEAPRAENPATDRLPVTLAIYDVRDLVLDLTLTDSVVEEVAAPSVETFSKERRKKVMSTLRQSVIAHMDPPFEKDVNQLQAQDADVLVLAGTARQHAWVEAFLAAHRAAENFVKVDTRFVEGPRGAFADPAGNRFFESDKEVEKYLTKLKQKNDIDLLSAPSLLTYPGQSATIQTVNQISYVESWRMHIVEPGGQEIADPEVAVIQEGIILKMRLVPIPKPAVQGENGSWSCPKELDYFLELEIENCTVERPIETKTIRLGSTGEGDREVQISVPQVTRVSLEARLSLRQGAAILIGGPSTEVDRDVAILIHLPELGELGVPSKKR